MVNVPDFSLVSSLALPCISDRELYRSDFKSVHEELTEDAVEGMRLNVSQIMPV